MAKDFQQPANSVSLTSAAEVIYLNGGDDTVYAGGGNDTVFGGAGADHLQGEGGADSIRGGTENDNLIGGDGNDRYLFARGDGEDFIIETSAGGTDRIVFDSGIASSDLIVGRSGNHLVVRIKGGNDAIQVSERYSQSNVLVENLEFADGTLLNVSSYSSAASTFVGLSGSEDIHGTTGNDAFYSGAGADNLHGDAGSDTYYFLQGDGVDTLWESAAASGSDKVIFGTGISTQMLDTHINGADLEITIAGSQDKLIINSWFSSTAPIIESFELADGTQWIPDAVELTPRTGTSLSDIFYGENGAEHFIGLAGNDTLVGGAGSDIFDGGTGNDYLQGDEGDDSVVFGFGYGLDTFMDATGQNEVRMLAGVSPVDVTVLIEELDIYLVLTGANDALRVSIAREGQAVNGVPIVKFDGGVVWSASDVLARSQQGITPFTYMLEGTSNDDVLVGNERTDYLHANDGNDVLDGKGGADFMIGGEGNDTYYVNHELDVVQDSTGFDQVFSKVSFVLPMGLEMLTLEGTANIDGTGNLTGNTLVGSSGNNTLIGLAGNDVLHGHAGSDALWGGEGDDQLFGGDDHDLIFGADGDDLLYGGTGNDVLRGGAGRDAYSLILVGGHDIVYESDDQPSDTDAIILESGILPSDVYLTRNGDDLVVSLAEENSSLTIKSFYLHERNEVEEIRFADNTVWDLPAMAPTGGGSAQSVLAMEEVADSWVDDSRADAIALVGTRFDTVEAFV